MQTATAPASLLGLKVHRLPVTTKQLCCALSPVGGAVGNLQQDTALKPTLVRHPGILKCSNPWCFVQRWWDANTQKKIADLAEEASPVVLALSTSIMTRAAGCCEAEDVGGQALLISWQEYDA